MLMPLLRPALLCEFKTFLNGWRVPDAGCKGTPWCMIEILSSVYLTWSPVHSTTPSSVEPC